MLRMLRMLHMLMETALRGASGGWGTGFEPSHITAFAGVKTLVENEKGWFEHPFFFYRMCRTQPTVVMHPTVATGTQPAVAMHPAVVTGIQPAVAMHPAVATGIQPAVAMHP